MTHPSTDKGNIMRSTIYTGKGSKVHCLTQHKKTYTAVLLKMLGGDF